jgi:hypothetical protein
MGLFTPTFSTDISKVLFVDDFVAASYNNRIWAVTGTGSITSLSSVGGVVRVRANAGASYRFNHGNFGSYSVAQQASITWYGSMIPAVAAGGLSSCGLQSSTAPTTSYMAWVYNPNTNANFTCICISAGTSTVFNSGITGNNLNHTFRIECYPGNVIFYFDNTLVTTITTNITANTLQPFVSCTGSAAAISDFNADWVYALGDRI